MLKIYISCNSLPNTEKSLAYLYSKIVSSDLKTVSVTLIHDSAFNLFELNKELNVEYIKGMDNAFEYPALHKLWVDSQSEDFYGLYLHCKGSSKTDEAVFNRDMRWVDCMLHGLLDNNEVCVSYLNRGADLVGSMWYRHFKGNFFWFNSSYIRNMPNPINWVSLKTPEGSNWYSRYDAEYWCCYAYWYGLYSPLPYPKVKNLYYLDRDFSDYTDKSLMPGLDKVYVCNNIKHNIENNLYDIYNEIHLTEEDYTLYKDILFKYVDFNNVIKIESNYSYTI